MRTVIWLVLSATLAASACTKPRHDQAPSNADQQGKSETGQSVPPPGTGPDAKTPFGPVDRIDPKSPEAARRIVQDYGTLVAQGRLNDAQALWASSDSASKFALQLERYSEVHLEIGEPGDEEGAAGSIYVAVPFTFFGRDRNDADVRRPAEIILRRVNDVPGSSETVRRWHIERIDWTVRT